MIRNQQLFERKTVHKK